MDHEVFNPWAWVMLFHIYGGPTCALMATIDSMWRRRSFRVWTDKDEFLLFLIMIFSGLGAIILYFIAALRIRCR